jgi:hypothetical protein
MKTKLFLLVALLATIITNAQDTKLIAEEGVLYLVDGEYGENSIFFYSNAYKKANIKLDEGEHTFVFSDWKSAYKFTIDMKSGVTYHLKKGKPLSLKADKKKLENITFEKVSVDKVKGVFSLTDESDKDKVATLFYSVKFLQEEDKFKGGNVYRLRRVDDYWGASRLGFHNGMDGNFTIYLNPGKHKLVAEVTNSSGTTKRRIISTMEYNFETGKKYTIELIGNFARVIEVSK